MTYWGCTTYGCERGIGAAREEMPADWKRCPECGSELTEITERGTPRSIARDEEEAAAEISGVDADYMREMADLRPNAVEDVGESDRQAMLAERAAGRHWAPPRTGRVPNSDPETDKLREAAPNEE